MRKRHFALAVALLIPTALSGSAFAQLDQLFKGAREKLGEEPTKQIAHFKIKGAVTETPVAFPPLFGGEPPLSLKTLLKRFRDARMDNNVVAVVVDLQQAGLGLGQLEEIHEAMRKFAAVDKPVYVHADSLTTGTYALATGAAHISIVPTGDLWLMGLYGETPYLRGTLDKIGCVPDFEHYEDFKTAGEIFMRSGPSEASEKMTKWLLDGIYDSLVARVADSRGLAADKVKSLIDDGPYSAEDALKAGLIDSVQHRQDFLAGLKERYGESVKIVSDYGDTDELKPPEDFFGFMNFLMQLMNPSPKTYTDPSVAVVYVEGTILPGEAEQSPFGPTGGAYSTTIRKALDRAAREDSVKAVVLRIDSPGGSALASEIILDASKRVAEKKPLIVSMGNVAGSGGYYVACGAETIFADNGTLTASVGVVGGKIVTTGMWGKLGVNWHSVQRGKMAAMLSTAAPFSPEERAKLKRYMETIYDIFKGHVRKARQNRLAKPLEELAGGRVFTGTQAVELGLIDRIGGFDDAVKYAAQRGGLPEHDINIRVIPEPPSIFDLFSGKKDDEYASSPVGTALRLAELPDLRAMLAVLEKIDPARVPAVMRSLQQIELLHDEGVITMMPYELVIR